MSAVHILNHGVSLCRLAGPPGEFWPEGHSFTGRGDQATCAQCVDVLRGRNLGDAYYTPRPLTQALLADFPWPVKIIGEPFAGMGWISNELLAADYRVITADISKTSAHPGVDFFSERAENLFAGVDCIVSNPPWNKAPACVRRALTMTPRVAMLLRLTFLEPCSEKPESARVDLLRRLSKVIVLPRTSFHKGRSGTDSVPPAWFIFDEDEGPTKLQVVDSTQLAEAAGQQRLIG